MPRLSEFYGISIYMNFSDHNLPNFHAIYAEHEAIIGVADGSTIRGGPSGIEPLQHDVAHGCSRSGD